MKKALRIFLIIGIVILTSFIVGITSFHIITAGTKLQPDRLIDYTKTVTIYDADGNKIENASSLNRRQTVGVSDLNDYTINAFIASEDRSFYSHNGLNHKRMLKALYKNITSMSFKEGASTISQQLIKNTHLSNDKTITRKLKEIKLTKQLEKKYEKNEILEMYLNTIYFGHSCYGLQNASAFYFDTTAENLTLEQSATLVGLLTSPNNNSPFKNPQKCLERRNTVLKSMLECKFIGENEYREAIAKPLDAVNNSTKNSYSSYINAVFEELGEIDIDPYGTFDELIIKTNMDKKMQSFVEKINADCDKSVILRDREGGICAYSSDIGMVKRQIGSAAKPLLVYAPALETDKIYPFTKILDEPINYNGYAPENYDKKYHGKVTVANSIKYSYNVPAVKTLNTVGFDDVENFAEKMNIEIKDEDKNLSLALGAMSEGLTLRQLCDGYSVFQNGGNFTESKFIREICDQNGKIIFKREQKQEKVFGEGTCSLMNEMLCETATSGTAKKLKQLNIDVACKTGTCGTSEGNTDAYALSYTQNYCLGVWLGDRNNKKLNVTGGTDCCEIAKSVWQELFSDKVCNTLDKTSGTATVQIDREEYENNDKIVLCEDISPKLNKLTVKCNKNNAPRDKSVKFTKPNIKTPSITVNNNKIDIVLCQTKYYSYLIKRKNGKQIDTIYDGSWRESITDEPSDGEYVYSVTPYYLYEGKKYFGKEIALPAVIVRKNSAEQDSPNITKKDWFNQ